LEINIYRIICELLTNSIKHSNATIVKISISKINNQIWVNYSDNGSGFDYFDALNNSSGIGISNIRNRVEFLKGNIQYRNHDGSNFLISFNQ
jgi:signal transduction histidine kinase